MEHISIGVYNYTNDKLCDLYDSFIQADGQAYNIVYTQELNGWKELTFNLPYVIESRRNFRWDYIKSEYLVRLSIGSVIEWFVLQKPKASKNSKAISNTVSCPHLSTLLKTKNLYLTFDDETGIGTVDELIARALTNTGWELGDCDTLYERDGITEKIRSLNSDGKKGAYQLVTDICNLFKAYPTYRFEGEHKYVDIHALNNKGPMAEMFIGKNLNGISVERATDNIITRLYVEGEYGDYGYVGIDDVNPTGLSYLMNFDYYQSIGVFTATHQAAYETYLSDMLASITSIKTKQRSILTAEDRLNTLWGQINYVVYELSGGTITNTITGGTVTDEQKTIAEGDELYVLKATGNYRIVTAGAGGSVAWENNDTLAAKFVTLPSGLIGSKQVAIESKEKIIATLTRDKNNQVDPLKQQSIQQQIDAQNAAIQELYSGYITYTLAAGGYFTTSGDTVDLTAVTSDTGWKNCLVPCIQDTKFLITGRSGSDQRLWCFVDASESDIAATTLMAAAANAVGSNTVITAPENTTHLVCNFNASYTAMLKQHILNGDGLYDEMREAIELAVSLDGLKNELIELQSGQLEIESTFADAMGDMLRDGYWSDNNYAPGQEEYLYQDAIDVINQMSKPTVTYTFSQVALSEEMGYTESLPAINDKVRVWDDELRLNDVVYVSKRAQHLDRSDKDTVEVTNDDPSLSGQSFESVLSRMSQLADLLQQKNTLYERAGAINANGSIYVDRLNGAIDVLKNKLSSTISNWYTDDSGAFVFESAAGDSAMMLSGGGWMIAAGKTQDGDWNWRTACDGYGLVADRITTGFLSADRIETGTITTNKLSAEVGAELNLSSNTTVAAVTSSHITLATDHIEIASGGRLDVNANADINIKGQGDLNVEENGNINVAANGDINIGADGDLNVNSGGEINVNSAGALNVASGGKIDVKSQGGIDIESGGKISVKSDGELDIASQGQLRVQGGGNVSIAASANLLPDSERERETNRFLSIPVADILTPYIGKTITVSFEILGSISRNFMVYAYQTSGVSIGETHIFTMPTSDFERFSFSTVVTDYTVQAGMTTGAIAFYDSAGEQDYSVRKIMIELGDTPSAWVPASGVTISEAGIAMNSGRLDFQAGSAINMESGGSFNVYATDDDSAIKFGGTANNPNFSLGAGGTVKAINGYFDNLTVQNTNLLSSPPDSLASSVVVSTTQPTGHGIIWIQPNAVSSVDYTLASGGQDMTGVQPEVTLSGFTGGTLAGSTCTYGAKFRIYNYSGSCVWQRVIVTIQKGSSAVLTIYDVSPNLYVGFGDYFVVNTLNAPSASLANITNEAGGFSATVTIHKSAATAARFEVNENFIIRCTNDSSTAAQQCNVYFVP